MLILHSYLNIYQRAYLILLQRSIFWWGSGRSPHDQRRWRVWRQPVGASLVVLVCSSQETGVVKPEKLGVSCGLAQFHQWSFCGEWGYSPRFAWGGRPHRRFILVRFNALASKNFSKLPKIPFPCVLKFRHPKNRRKVTKTTLGFGLSWKIAVSVQNRFCPPPS